MCWRALDHWILRPIACEPRLQECRNFTQVQRNRFVTRVKSCLQRRISKIGGMGQFSRDMAQLLPCNSLRLTRLPTITFCLGALCHEFSFQFARCRYRVLDDLHARRWWPFGSSRDFRHCTNDATLATARNAFRVFPTRELASWMIGQSTRGRLHPLRLVL